MILLTKNLLLCSKANKKIILCKYQRKMENPNTYSTYIRKKYEKKNLVQKISYFTFTREKHE